jgi:hypothetical protein
MTRLTPFATVLAVLGFGGIMGCSQEPPPPPPLAAPPVGQPSVAPARTQTDSLTTRAHPITGAHHEVLVVADGVNFQMIPPALTVHSGDGIRFRAMSGGHVLTLDPFGVTAADSAMAQFRANAGAGVGRNATALLDGNGAMLDLSMGGMPPGLYRVHSTAYSDFGATLALTILGPRPSSAGHAETCLAAVRTRSYTGRQAQRRPARGPRRRAVALCAHDVAGD